MLIISKKTLAISLLTAGLAASNAQGIGFLASWIYNQPTKQQQEISGDLEAWRATSRFYAAAESEIATPETVIASVDNVLEAKKALFGDTIFHRCFYFVRSWRNALLGCYDNLDQLWVLDNKQIALYATLNNKFNATERKTIHDALEARGLLKRVK